MELSNYFAQMKRAPLVAGLCAAMLAPTPSQADGFWDRSYEPARHFSNVQEAADRFKLKQDAAIAAPTVATNGDYLRAGINLSDIACDEWIGVLGRSDRDVSFFKDMLNIVGNVILGISGINGANPSSLARGSLGLAAGNASIDAFKNEIILGSLSDIDAKLREGRKVTAATIKANAPENFDDAKGMLLSYHADCSPNAIKVLLKTSLAAVKYVAPDTSLTEPIRKAQTETLVGKLVIDMYGAGSQKKLSLDTIYKLYVTQLAGVGDNAPAFVPGMKADIKDLEADFVAANKDKRLEWLKAIADLNGFGIRYDADVAATQTKADEAVKKIAGEADDATKTAVETKAVAPAKELAKVPESAKPSLKEFFAAPMSKSMSSQVIQHFKDSSRALQQKSTDTKALRHAKALSDLADKEKELSAAKAAAEKIRAAPKAPAADTKLLGIKTPPVSVNAILVPAN